MYTHQLSVILLIINTICYKLHNFNLASLLLILWAQVIFFSLLTLCMIYTIYSTVRFFYSYCTRNRQQTRVQTLEVEMTREVLQQAIEHKLGSKLYKDLKDQKNYESQCVICLEQFEEET